MRSPTWGFLEFFAGGGMARLGLGRRWRCLFANEICEKKARAYRANFGACPELRVEDIRRLSAADLPASAMLAWGSFPCQDLSLAGNGAGLKGERSGTFVPFWRLADAVRPPIVVLENVGGVLTSNAGRDFRVILEWIARSGYRAGAMVIDAALFVPQSRPRVFLVAARDGMEIPPGLAGDAPSEPWHPPRLRAAVAALPAGLRRRWLWWRMPAPPPRVPSLAGLMEEDPMGVQWRAPEETRRLLGMMTEAHLRKLRAAQARGRKTVGTVYRRMRTGPDGVRAQRAEVRFDQVSGCLRTPAGGSSRESVLVVEGASVRSRLLSAREAARLMGLPDSYRLPANYNEAYHVAGDGLVVPAVAWLEKHVLRPLASSAP
ncbi:MAG: DNA cytosine methyltransferase [Bryobacteraceae bacterium]|jgi:DNA (cytosine-5)-methyltransferase 1